MAQKHKTRRRVSNETWQQVRSAFLVGGEIRAIARAAGLNENTVLAKAAKEGWTSQRREALHLREGAQSEGQGAAAWSGEQSLAITRESLLGRHLLNMLTVAGKLSDHAVSLSPESAFTNVRQIDVADRLARRQLGLDKEQPAVMVNLWGGSAIQAGAFRDVEEADGCYAQ